MKKIVKLSLILLMTVFIVGNVYAALSCEINIGASKTEVSKNEEFTVDINLANIQSERGVISMGATLEYDKESLTLVKMEGKNSWETPIEGVSYNQNNGKLAITRNGLGKENETVFTVTFKVKETSKQNLMVTLKNITVADGTTPAKISLAYKNITVKDGSANPVPQPGTDDNTNNTTNSNTTNSSLIGNATNNTNKNTVTNTLNKNTVNNSSLPKAGDSTGMIFAVLITIAVLVAGVFLVKMKILKHKIEK